MADKKAFGLRMWQAMDAEGFTLATLSACLGIAVSTVWNYQCGRYLPSIERLEAIAEVLDVSPAWLLGWQTRKK